MEQVLITDHAVTFSVPGKPVGKGRPRVGRGGGHARMFTPEKNVSSENLVGWTAAQAMAGRQVITGPVNVRLHIAMDIPASWSKVKQQRALEGLEHPTTKPDMDNVIKAIFDAMNGVVWKDDVQVIGLSTSKAYGQAPGVRVEVREIA
jgi:Holliday junction resolvase RusA-like endonuclease